MTEGFKVFLTAMLACILVSQFVGACTIGYRFSRIEHKIESRDVPSQD